MTNGIRGDAPTQARSKLGVAFGDQPCYGSPARIASALTSWPDRTSRAQIVRWAAACSAAPCMPHGTFTASSVVFPSESLLVLTR
jgi:hypothetical protein